MSTLEIVKMAIQPPPEGSPAAMMLQVLRSIAQAPEGSPMGMVLRAMKHTRLSQEQRSVSPRGPAPLRIEAVLGLELSDEDRTLLQQLAEPDS